jgi:hypothetical protein
MGFDINIIINTRIDELTGLPFVLLSSKPIIKKSYNPSEYQIPKEYRKYINQHGHHFHSYIKVFDDTTNQCDVQIFLHYYPKWDDIKHEILDDDDWTKEDHNEFKMCLEWLESKSGVYGISWSY